jgi:hypothetical protein
VPCGERAGRRIAISLLADCLSEALGQFGIECEGEE